MSAASNSGSNTGSNAASQQPAARSRFARIAKPVAWTLLGLFVLVFAVLAGVAWYTTTADFQRRVGKEVVSVLEDSTGGRAELGSIQFNLWHLAVDARGLVIHGTEGPGEAPYLAADRLLVRVQLLDLLGRWTGGAASHVGLSLLRVEHPQVHLIIDKEGKTNQPVPKHPSTSTEPVIDTLLDLKAHEVELVDGVALLNDRAIPFDLLAKELNAQVQYLAATDRYGATIDLADLRTKMQKEPEAQSKLHVTAQVGRDIAELNSFELETGQDSGHLSTLKASGSLEHFAQPVWQAKILGALELRQISVLSGFDGLNAGTVDLDLGGHSCGTAPAEAQKKPSFFQRERSRLGRKPAPPSVKVLPPDPDCEKGYLLVGSAKLHNAAYADANVRLRNVNAGAELRITPTELLFNAITGTLAEGGSATGDLRIMNWLGEVPAGATSTTTSATVAGAATTANKTAAAVGAAPVVKTDTTLPQVARAHAYLTATANKIALRTIMDIAAPKGTGDLGFDTAISGPIKAEWGGPATEIADTVDVDTDLKLTPTGARRKGAASSIPVSGTVQAHYTGKTQAVQLKRVDVHTPGSSLVASGVLGVAKGDRLTDLHADLSVRDLSEYDQLLQTVGVASNGKKGVAALPVVLHGAVEFNGTARGALADLDLKGHLQAAGVEYKQGTTDVQVDSLVADAEYSPQTGLAVATSTIKRGTAVLNVTGTAHPRRAVSRRGVVSYVWDNGSQVDAKVQLANAQLVDVLQLAGRATVPVTGTLSVNGNVAGTLKNLSGGGQATLLNGVAYGEPYESAVVTATVKGQDIEASSVALKLHGMQIAGNGGYDLGTQRLHAHVEGNNLQLSKFTTVQKAGSSLDGTLSLVADANGTVAEPGLKAKLRLANLTMNGAALGEVAADVHSEGKVVSYTANSTLVGAKLQLAGTTQLVGDYQTQAKLMLSGLDVAQPIAIFAPGSIKATSAISGVVTVSGPAANPQQMSGLAELDNVDVKLQGIELKAAEPVRVSLTKGVARLEQVHITGLDTDLRASGTAQVFGAVDAKGQPDAMGGKIDLRSTGSLNVALAHTFDPDLISSGKVVFTVAAGGTLKKPALTGNVDIQKVNFAIDGIPNGLTDLNGRLIFNEDRLQVQNLTATTGGGQIKLGGFLTYTGGIYANLTATGEKVRVRLYGLSATANIGLTLQGGPDDLRLGGNVLLTRFGIGPDVDFAAFASTGGVVAPPDPDALTNHIRMDIHVTSSPQLNFQNSYAKLAGTVDLKMRGTVAEPSVLGRIQITDGSATFAGTTYQLQRGDVYFSNPVRIDPVVDLDATARVQSYDVTIGLHGTAANLKPTYRSEPPLSEADVFSLLALGRTQEQAQLYQEQQVQAGTDPTTSSLLGGALNATVSSRVSKLFGGGSVKIDPAFVGTLGNSSARITVQEQLSRQITAVFATNVNQSAQQLIQVQYALSPTRSLVVTRDETGVFSIVFKLRQRYK